jgi:uncharacterized protein (TIGR03435 family)
MMRTVLAAGLLIWISGVAYGAEPSFDVASIKPSAPGTREGFAIQPGGRLVAAGVPLKLLISLAWHLQGYQLAGGDSWTVDDRWSIEAKADDIGDVPAWAPPNVPEVIAARVRSLLVERFALKTHQEMRTLPVYRLSVGPGGSRLGAADSSTAPAGIRAGPGVIIAVNATMEQFLTVLGRSMDRPVIDKTGIAGPFNAKLQFAPESAPRQLSGAAPDGAASTDPSIFTAVQEQLGLKLEAAQELVQVLVIDHAERPSAN